MNEKETIILEEKRPFYRRAWFIVLMIVLVFPLGLWLMYRYTVWPRKVKNITAAVVCALMVFIIIPVLLGLITNIAGLWDNGAEPWVTYPSTPSVTHSEPAGSSSAPSEESSKYHPFSGIAKAEQGVTEVDLKNARFVLNLSTKKIHASDCAEVKRILPENLGTTNDYAGAKAQGYIPCKKCNP